VKSRGQTIEESAQMFTNIISGNGTEAQNNVVCANAGMAINDNEMYTPLEGFQIAKESLISGKGLKALTTLQELSKATNPKGDLG
jgi:anthranilate phosphoribosyltransferase